VGGGGKKDVRSGGIKKKPAVGGLESIFLEEDRGDRKHDAASHNNRPMIVRDSGYLPGA
jgi:hypothetical protein